MDTETIDGVLSDLLGASLKEQFSGRSTASSSNSSTNVSVNPAISIVTGGGQSSPSTSGYASGSPSSSASATPGADVSGYGNPDSTIWPAQNMPPVSDSDFLSGDVMGLPLWGWAVVIVGVGIFAFGKKGKK